MHNSSTNFCCPHIEISVLLDPTYKAIYDQVFFLLQAGTSSSLGFNVNLRIISSQTVRAAFSSE